MQDALGSRGNLRGSGRQAWWEQKGEVPPGSHRRIGLSCLDNCVSWEGDEPHRLRTRWGAANLAYRGASLVGSFSFWVGTFLARVGNSQQDLATLGASRTSQRPTEFTPYSASTCTCLAG